MVQTYFSAWLAEHNARVADNVAKTAERPVEMARKNFEIGNTTVIDTQEAKPSGTMPSLADQRIYRVGQRQICTRTTDRTLRLTSRYPTSVRHSSSKCRTGQRRLMGRTSPPNKAITTYKLPSSTTDSIPWTPRASGKAPTANQRRGQTQFGATPTCNASRTSSPP